MNQSDESKLRPLIAQLPRSIEPPRDLWPAVAQRTVRRRPRRRLVAIAAAALILVAAASSLATAWLLQPAAGGDPVLVSAALEHREAAYLRTTNALTDELAARRDELAPETVAVLERNLAIIDRAIAESRAALASDPANDVLAELLWASYQRKVALLEQAARVATPI